MRRIYLLLSLIIASCDADKVGGGKSGGMDPPRQHVDWCMPEGVVDEGGRMAACVSLLFEQGMADPRGLPYHHLRVREGGDLIDARGWVMPAQEGMTTRRAIGWTGLVYPVDEVGELADLSADIALLAKQGHFGGVAYHHSLDESLDGVVGKFRGASRMMYPFAAPYLLLRLGYPVASGADAATSGGGQVVAGLEEVPSFDVRRFPESPYLALFDFVKVARDDGVAAWLDKDYRVVALRLDQFDRGMKRVQEHIGDAGGYPMGSGLEQVKLLNGCWRELLVDGRRRLSCSAKVEGDSVSEAIASWEHLDQWSDENPPAPYRLVADSGPAAIRPLLKCMSEDRRWTRIVRDDSRHGVAGRILRVRDLAFRAFEEVVQFSYVPLASKRGWLSDECYEEAAERCRNLSERYEHQWGAELWYRILKDPKADRELQIEAARAIVTPVDFPTYANHGEPDVERTLRNEDSCPDASRMLLDRDRPSVLEAMSAAWQRECLRVDEALKAGEPEYVAKSGQGGGVRFLREDAHCLMHYMEDWKPGNIDLLQMHYRWLDAGLKAARSENPMVACRLMLMCQEALIWRFRSNDQTAIADYAGLFESSVSDLVLPLDVLEVAPVTDEIDRVIAGAFLGDEAPLSLTKKPWTGSDRRAMLMRIDSPLMKYASFRKALWEALECREVQATLGMSDQGASLRYHADPGGDPVPLYLTVGLRGSHNVPYEGEVRVCDLVAYFLTTALKQASPAGEFRDGWLAPDFRLDDPVLDRDKEIAGWKERLGRYR